jgi:isoamylase
MIAFRKAHAAFCPFNFYSSTQLAWWTLAGTTPDASYFNSGSNHTIAYQFNGSALDDSYSSLYVAYNGWSGEINFILPSPSKLMTWYRVTDTCARAEGPNQVRPPAQRSLLADKALAFAHAVADCCC